MKFCRTIALFGAFIASSVPSAFAALPALRATVPFTFMVGNRQMPAGEYTIATSTGASGIFYIRGEGQGVAVLSAPPTPAAKRMTAPGLMFTTRGSQKYLVGVQMQGEAERTIAAPALRPASVAVSQ